jgi:cytochrome c biogenesis protein CcmG/thiol:disulfide interchange protein DsbE
MKKVFFILLLLGIGFQLSAQVPATQIKSIDMDNVNTEEFNNDGKPFVISFWATWCSPCIKELNAIHDQYIDWQDETGVKLIAVSIDDQRNAPRVKPFVSGRNWEYEIYIDTNSDFKRAMNVGNIPHTFLFNGEGKLVWQHTSYASGDEEELYDRILELVEGE